jgi:hypothetical protein
VAREGGCSLISGLLAQLANRIVESINPVMENFLVTVRFIFLVFSFI